MKNKIAIISAPFFVLAVVVLMVMRTWKSNTVPQNNHKNQTPAELGAEAKGNIQPFENKKTGIFSAGNIRLRVEIAETEEERIRGLGGRERIADDLGMLFVLPESDFHGVWMRDMMFPLDVIWLDEEFRVIDIRENIAVETYPKVFYPVNPARYALEINGQTAAKQGIEIGAVFTLKR